MLYLLRHPEIGKEPRPEKSKARRDILDSLAALCPGATTATDIGRIFVESDRDIGAELAQLHGVTSYSPCERCALADLEGATLAMAGRLLAGGKRFAVRVRRAKSQKLHAQELARQLGTAILAAVAGARVDLKTPEVEIGVETRGDVAYLFHEVLPGLDEKIRGERRPYEQARFIVDHMLGTLAARLRLLGFDTTFYRDTADSLLLRRSDDEQRTLLTQDRGLARLGAGSAYFVASHELEDQVREVLDHFGLTVDADAVLSRCSLCNTPIEPVEKARVEGKVPGRVFSSYEAFYRCPPCDKIYWKGAHHENMRL